MTSPTECCSVGAMKVYRIETVSPVLGFKVEHVGPYNAPVSGYRDSKLRNDLINAHHRNDEHPPMNRDFDDFRTFKQEYLCGSDSPEALRTWFGPFFKRLLDTGIFREAVYEVPDELVIRSISGRQVAFKPTDARRLDAPARA